MLYYTRCEERPAGAVVASVLDKKSSGVERTKYFQPAHRKGGGGVGTEACEVLHRFWGYASEGKGKVGCTCKKPRGIAMNAHCKGGGGVGNGGL